MQNVLQFKNTDQRYTFGMVQSLLFIKRTILQTMELDLASRETVSTFIKKIELKKCEKLIKDPSGLSTTTRGLIGRFLGQSSMKIIVEDEIFSLENDLNLKNYL